MVAQWVQTGGPGGGYIHSITDDYLFYYVGTFGSVCRIGKGGTLWTTLPGINGAYSLTVSGSTLLAGLDGGGVYRSEDHGMTWYYSVSGLYHGSSIFTFAVNGEDLLAGTGHGVYLSSDHGVNWTPINTGMEDVAVQSLLVKGSDIFAGTIGGGIYRSTNYGTTWLPINNGLKHDSLWVNTLAIVHDTLFAGTWWADGVYRSDDNGDTWTIANSGLGNPDVKTFAVIDTMLIAGTTHGWSYYSVDMGETWGLLDDAPGDVSCFHVSNETILGGTDYGIYFSKDTGDSWESNSDGIISTMITSLYRSGTKLFAGTASCNLFRSENEGTSWEKLNMSDAYITSVLECGTDLFAGASHGVCRSEDGGDSWSPANTGMEFEQISSLAVIEDGTDYLFAGADTSGVFLSTDKGQSWARANNGLTDTLVHCLAVSGTDLFAGTGNGVFLSTDKGASWTHASTGLTGGPVSSLAVNSGNIFAGSTSGVYRSANSGTSWTPANTGLTDLNIKCLLANDKYLFAGTWFDQVFLSEDNGDTWANVNEGLRKIPVLSLALSATDIFAGLRGGGVWKCPLSGIVTSVQPLTGEIQNDFMLEQNHPNPFTDITKICFNVPFRTRVLLNVYDQSGREVRVLTDRELAPGRYEVLFDGKRLPEGVYFYRMQAGEFIQTRKFVLLR